MFQFHHLHQCKNDKDMKKIGKYIKIGLNWYSRQLIEFYKPMIEANVPIIL